MTAYLISICRGVSDRRRLEEYWAKVGPTFEGSGAKPLVAYKPFEILEPGPQTVEGVVLFEFPSIEAAKRWYNGPAYQERKRGRLGAAEFELILVEGGVVPADQRLPQIKT